MARDVTDETGISSKDELVAWLEAGVKSPEAFRIGAEHEKIPFYRADHAPVPYRGTGGQGGGVESLLQGLGAKTGWEPIMDGAALIGLADDKTGAAISLEPGGQFELSGAPLEDIHAIQTEFDRHIADLRAVADPLGVGFLSLGMSPLWRREQTPIMPKQRYAIMTGYMPKVGARGLDMMFRTSTVQVNLDFASEADMVRKMRVALALQPLTTALFANSPFTDGRPNGFLSMRSEIWRDTDKDRTGVPPFVFEPGMGFERYVDYALGAPMYFVKRGARYHDVAGARFSDLMAGKLPQLPGERATMADWVNHLSTIFPEVRLKRYLEMRGADVGPRSHIMALPALFVGLLYDGAALDGAQQIVAPWSIQDILRMRDEVPKQGLATQIDGRDLRAVAFDILKLARAGLARRAKCDVAGRDETIYLDALQKIAESGRPLAKDWLNHYATDWRESVLPTFEVCTFW